MQNKNNKTNGVEKVIRLNFLDKIGGCPVLAALVYLRDCIESGIEPGMGKVNEAIRQARGAA
jgi:hypothetical protein